LDSSRHFNVSHHQLHATTSCTRNTKIPQSTTLSFCTIHNTSIALINHRITIQTTAKKMYYFNFLGTLMFLPPQVVLTGE
jgi:hypothetical protein